MQGYAGDKYTPQVGEGHITIFPWHYSAIIQGTFAWWAQSPQMFYGAFANIATHALNDQIDYKVYLDVGTYTLIILTITESDFGIISILLDTVSQGTIDCWIAAGTGYNEIKSLANIVVASGGLKTLSLKITGKTGSNYYMAISAINLYRTV